MPTGGAVWPWIALVGLGAFHGINPGMGWLFAVALGMQEGRSRAVWRSLLPLGLGHVAAVAAALAVALALETVIPVGALKWPIAALLVGIGLYRLMRHRHPRYGGMRVGMLQLGVWSFLMATAHGAGLMVVPVFLGMTAEVPSMAAGSPSAEVTAPAAAAVHHEPLGHGAALSAGSHSLTGLLATVVHGAAYLLVTALVAWIVYEKLGVLFLRRAWMNLDLVWAAALILTGFLTTLM